MCIGEVEMNERVFKGFVGKDSDRKNTMGPESSRIYNNCRIYDTILSEK